MTGFADLRTFLDRLRTLCTNANAGEPRRFKIQFEAMSVMSYDVKDGYFVVLLVDSTFNEVSCSGVRA